MRMDPVLVLIEELRGAESSLRAAACRHRGAGGAELRHLRAEIALIEGCIAETAPTSAPGAGELVRLAAEYVQRPHLLLAEKLSDIAHRLCEGERLLDDMIWLRATERFLAGDPCGERSTSAARLLHSALAGAARPVLVYRSARQPMRAAS